MKDQRAGAAVALGSDTSENHAATGPTLVELRMAIGYFLDNEPPPTLAGCLRNMKETMREAADRIEALEAREMVISRDNDRLRAELAKARKIQREPTKDMTDAASIVWGCVRRGVMRKSFAEVWKAMYDAAMRAAGDNKP